MLRKGRGADSHGSVRQLLKNKGYLLLVLIYLLVYMIGTADQYVVIDKMLDIGADTTAVGIKGAAILYGGAALSVFLENTGTLSD